MITNYLTKENFYAYTGLNIQNVNDNLVTILLQKFNNSVNIKLGQVFSFALNKTVKYYNRIGEMICLIDNWQDNGVVNSITVTNGGTGYSQNPVVTITGTNTHDATATATVNASGVITAIKITDQGSGYSTAPTVTISDSTGVNATATATISTITVYLGYDNSSPPVLLAEGADFRFMPFSQSLNPERVQPINAVKLYNELLYPVYNKGFLQITGTFGYSPQVPEETLLDLKLYDYIKFATTNAQNYADSGGKGPVRSTGHDSVSVSFGNTWYETLSVGDSITLGNQYIDQVLEMYSFKPSEALSIIG